MIFRDIERQIHPQRVINKVVFDLDLIMKQQDPDADDNCLLAVAKEQLKFGHARKPSNSRFVVHRHTEIRYTVIESLSFIRAVIKRRGPEIYRGYYERGPRLLWKETRRKMESKGTLSWPIPRLLFLFTRQLKILVTTLASCWEFLKIEKEQIKTAQKNSYGKKCRETTNLGVGIMNSNRQVKRKFGHVVQIRVCCLT